MKLQKSRKNPDKNSIEIHLIQQQIDECRNKLETCEKTIKEQKIHLLRFKKKYSFAPSNRIVNRSNLCFQGNRTTQNKAKIKMCPKM